MNEASEEVPFTPLQERLLQLATVQGTLDGIAAAMQEGRRNGEWPEQLRECAQRIGEFSEWICPR